MSDPRLPRVAFLIVGAQKGGTTALDAHLRHSPGLCLPQRKELHFFDDETGVDWASPDYAAYEAAFAHAAPGQICGEATPYYMFRPECLDRIRAYNPAMRLVAILRDPVARAHSHWRMQVTRGAEDQPFSRAIREGRARVSGNLRNFSYVERGFYAAQIDEMLRRFPRGQMHVLLNEDLAATPDRTLADLCGFLGARPSARLPQAEEIGYFRSDSALAPPDPEDMAYLRALYRDDIRRTETLIGRDLSAWL